MNQDYWEIKAAARNYFDSHQFTTSLTNRQKALARHKDKHGNPDPLFNDGLNAQLESAKVARDAIGKDLDAMYRQLAPPAIVKFQAETVGLGERYMAQLVGLVGDFRVFTEAWWEITEDGSQLPTDSQRPGADDDRPARKPEKRILRTGDVLTAGVRDIWTFCGHGDASARRRKGQDQAEAFKAGNPLAKSIVNQMAEICTTLNGVPDKNGKARGLSPYYPYFVKVKAEAAAAHPKWSKGHCQNHATRLTGKAILKDIWRVQHDEPPVFGARTYWAGPRKGERDRRARVVVPQAA